jgi:hypothetical protein
MPQPESATMVELMSGPRVLASWPLTTSRLDLSVIDELARLQLEARRRGWSIRLRTRCRRLAELLNVTGLDRVVATIEVLGVEVDGEAEGREQGGIEEGVDLRNESP